MSAGRCHWCPVMIKAFHKLAVTIAGMITFLQTKVMPHAASIYFIYRCTRSAASGSAPAVSRKKTETELEELSWAWLLPPLKLLLLYNMSWFRKWTDGWPGKLKNNMQELLSEEIWDGEPVFSRAETSEWYPDGKAVFMWIKIGCRTVLNICNGHLFRKITHEVEFLRQRYVSLPKVTIELEALMKWLDPKQVTLFKKWDLKCVFGSRVCRFQLGMGSKMCFCIPRLPYSDRNGI